MPTRETTSQPGIFRYHTKSGTRYRVVVDAGPGVDGKRQQVTRSGFTSMAEAKRARGELLNDAGKVARGSITLAAFVPSWLSAVTPTVRASTLIGYERSLRLYALPRLGSRSLASITAVDVQAMQEAMLHAGRAPNTVKGARLALYLVFKQAVRWGLVERNPVSDVDAPTAPASGGDVWTAEEARRFLLATENETHGALWAVLLATSVRIGEALALTWGAVDLKAGTITIRQSLTRITGGVYVLGEPKTENARRTIALGPVGLAAVSRLPRGTAGAFVFPGASGQWLHPESARLAFVAACKRHELPRIRIHDLRHISISLAVAAGVPMIVVSRRAGHANIRITMDRYTHLAPQSDHDAAGVLGRILSDRDPIVTSEEKTS